MQKLVSGGARTRIRVSPEDVGTDCSRLASFPPQLALALQHYRWQLEACGSAVARTTKMSWNGVVEFGPKVDYGVSVATLSWLHTCTQIAFSERAGNREKALSPIYEAIVRGERANQLQTQQVAGHFFTCEGADGTQWTYSGLVTELISWFQDTQLAVGMAMLTKEESRRVLQNLHLKHRAKACSLLRELMLTPSVRSGST